MKIAKNDYDFQIGAEPSHQLEKLNLGKRTSKLVQAVYIYITNSLLVNRLQNRLQEIKLLQTLQALITYYKNRLRSQCVTLKLIAAENIQTMAFKV